MTEKQLDQDAADYCRVNLYDSEPYRQDVYEAFRDGMEHTMEHPLADRLTEEEKDKIIVMHNIAKDWASEGNSGRCYAIYRDIERIFGTDLFTDKPE